MTHIRNLVALFLLALVGNAAFAATYYESKDNCDAAWRAGRAVGYQPTARHVQFGDKRIAGMSMRRLEGDACVLLGAQPGKRWVFLSQGTFVYTKGPVVNFLAECQNDIYELAYLKKEESAPPPPPAASAPATGAVVVQTTILCRQPDGTSVSAKIESGVATCPTITVNTPVLVAPPVASAASAPATCKDCTPPRNQTAGTGGLCRIKAGTDRVPECNFPWKVLRTQDQVESCGCQILVPTPRQIIGFPDAAPGSPRCEQQKKLWTEVQGLVYSSAPYKG